MQIAKNIPKDCNSMIQQNTRLSQYLKVKIYLLITLEVRKLELTLIIGKFYTIDVD